MRERLVAKTAKSYKIALQKMTRASLRGREQLAIRTLAWRGSSSHESRVTSTSTSTCTSLGGAAQRVDTCRAIPQTGWEIGIIG